MSAALALSRVGRRVLVVERELEPSAEGAGIQLSPNASRHLRDWGVLAALGDAALAPRSVVIRRAGDARLLVEMPLNGAERRWDAPYRVAHRADVTRALEQLCAREPNITARRGVALTGWREDKAFSVVLSDGVTLEAEALVVADGVHSRLRSALLGLTDRPATPSGRVAWRALAPINAAPGWAREPRSNLWLGGRAHLVHYPLRGGTVVNLVAVTQGDVAEDGRVWSRRGDPALLLRRFAGWHEDALALLRAGAGWRVWPLLQRPTPPALARGRVALAGDAAHPMMPFLAQGAAQAIEDAAALGEAFRVHADPTRALAAYDAMRRSRASRVVSASARQGRIYHLRGPAAFARDTALRVMGPRGMTLATDWLYDE